ncbi:MAG: hypothetical protein IT512_12505 [Rhodocyclaceae bacterium]|nr:hypothetical protein [Rhodocyclaceae bacterium]
MPGNVYSMPGVLRDDFLVAWWLQGFYNGLPNFERGTSSDTDSLVLNKYFIDRIRKQAQVEAVVGPAKDALKQNAYQMLSKLACGQSGTFSNRGREIVMGDDDSYSVHLAIGSFSIYWEATCRVGPKRCCVKSADSLSGYEESAPYSCKVDFTIYDNFNFSWKTGTGGTGLLKRINPLGWFGTSFHQYGRWSETIEGTRRRDMSAADVAAFCCTKPKTVVDPPPPPPPPVQPPPVTQPPPADAPPQPCPECDPIARSIELTRQAIAREAAEIVKFERLREDNRKKQKELGDKIRELQSELEKGQWTASGTDTETGITKEYDATRGDGNVHVTVRDAAGRVIDSYSYARSRNTTEIRHKIETFEKLLQGLRDDEAYIDKAIKAAQERKARLEAELKRLQAELEECLKRCRGMTQTPRQGVRIGQDPKVGRPGGECAFAPAKPVTIGPREQFGYGDEQKAGEVGKAAIGILGGFLGGRGGGGGRSGGGPFQGGPSGADKPRLADDPIRDKQTFTDAQTGTAIKVGGQYRPDGKLLVSVDVDKAEDKGVVHQATMERLQPQPDGGCKTQVAEPVEWLHYEIWEDWWAKIRIQRYESVDGGPWRKTHDTGWRDWGSGSRLLESGTMSADQIPRTAWGSMGADRAFGGPRSAGAVFDPGRPMVTGQPAPERLVVHVTQPGKDPVTTIPFTLYPTYGADGKVSYGDTAPDLDALRKTKLPMGGGMQQIDPPATGAAPRESILESIDSGVGKTPLAK